MKFSRRGFVTAGAALLVAACSKPLPSAPELDDQFQATAQANTTVTGALTAAGLSLSFSQSMPEYVISINGIGPTRSDQGWLFSINGIQFGENSAVQQSVRPGDLIHCSLVTTRQEG